MTLYERLIICLNGCEEGVRDIIIDLKCEDLLTPEIESVLIRRLNKIRKRRNEVEENNH